jgi:hypothetical protein
MFVISSILGRRVYITEPYGTIYPNLWVLLIGPSTISHKSTTLQHSNDIIQNVSPANIMSNMFSPEGIIQELSEQPNNTGVMIKDEFGGILTNMTREYMSNTKDLLMELYDGNQKIKRRLRTETITINTPYVTWLTATTPSRFYQTFKYEDLYTGFINRFISIKYDNNRQTKYTELPIENISMARTDIIVKLIELDNKLNQLESPISIILSKEAKKIYKTYQDQRINNAKYDHEFAMLGRSFINILKFCIINTISELDINNYDGSQLEVSPDTMIESIILNDSILNSNLELINYLQLNPAVIRIYDIINQNKEPIPHSLLLRRSRMLDNELQNILNTLHKLLLIETINRDDKEKLYNAIGKL